MMLSNSNSNIEEYFVNCKDSACSEEIFLGLLDSVQLINVAAFGLHCPRCHKKWVYDKNSIHIRNQIV